MDPTMSREYLIVGDHFLVFGTTMNNYLINQNQVRVVNIPVNDNPFNATFFLLQADEAFVHFTYKGKVISFEPRVPTAWEEHNLLVMFLTVGQWDPMNVDLGSSTNEQT